MDVIELIFDGISETDIYTEDVKPSLLIKKKDLTGLGIKEIESNAVFSEIENELGVKVKIYNDPTIDQYGWHDIDENFGEKMTMKMLKCFHGRANLIESAQGNGVALIEEIYDTVEFLYNEIQLIQQSLGISFENIREESENTDDFSEKEQLKFYALRVSESSDKTNNVFEMLNLEINKMRQLLETFNSYSSVVKSIKNDIKNGFK